MGIDLPEALLVSCLLAAVPGATVGLLFTFLIIGVLTIGIGGAEVAPVGLAIATAYLCMTGFRMLTNDQTTKRELKDASVPVPAGPAGPGHTGVER